MKRSKIPKSRFPNFKIKLMILIKPWISLRTNSNRRIFMLLNQKFQKPRKPIWRVIPCLISRYSSSRRRSKGWNLKVDSSTRRLRIRITVYLGTFLKCRPCLTLRIFKLWLIQRWELWILKVHLNQGKLMTRIRSKVRTTMRTISTTFWSLTKVNLNPYLLTRLVSIPMQELEVVQRWGQDLMLVEIDKWEP